MDLDEALRTFGIDVDETRLDAIRAALSRESELESASQGNGNTEAMRLFCAHLFGAGHVEDALLIWRAKESSWDASCSIDVQLVCGAGLAETKAFLAAQGSDAAKKALGRIVEGEAGGDFEEFSPAAWMEDCRRYYASQGPDENE